MLMYNSKENFKNWKSCSGTRRPYNV